jgi:hypothetical protein
MQFQSIASVLKRSPPSPILQTATCTPELVSSPDSIISPNSPQRPLSQRLAMQLHAASKARTTAAASLPALPRAAPHPNPSIQARRPRARQLSLRWRLRHGVPLFFADKARCAHGPGGHEAAYAALAPPARAGGASYAEVSRVAPAWVFETGGGDRRKSGMCLA